jgi:hypothetical protein
MEKVIGPRQSGRTTRMIEMALRKNAYLVVMNQSEERRIRKDLLFKGKTIPKMMTFHELVTQQYYPPGLNAVVIDNADLLLSYIVKLVPVEGISILS